MTDVNANVNDFDLEYRDVVKDPANQEMQQIAAEIPERYKGKSSEELVQMHVNLEKVLRRQGNELGQLRRLSDMQAQALANYTSNVAPRAPAAQEPKREPITAETLLSDPEQAINQAVAPAVAPVHNRLTAIEQSLARQQFEDKNPSYLKDVQSPEFQEWVLASSTRSRLLMGLHQYDFSAGNELWDLWNEHKSTAEAAKAARADKTRAASTVRNSAGEPVGKPIYSRAKLMELQMRALNGDPAAQVKWNDPEFQREYQLAYAEQRVK